MAGIVVHTKCILKSQARLEPNGDSDMVRHEIEEIPLHVYMEETDDLGRTEMHWVLHRSHDVHAASTEGGCQLHFLTRH